MLTGHGAINGRELNHFEIDAGNFSVDLDDATATVGIVASLSTSVAYQLSGRSSITFQGLLGLFKPPFELEGSMDVQFDATLRLDRRLDAPGISVSQVDLSGMPSVRVSLSGDMPVDPLLSGIFDRHFIAFWSTDRRIEVSVGLGRKLALQPEPRDSDVVAKEGVVERQKDDVIQ